MRFVLIGLHLLAAGLIACSSTGSGSDGGADGASDGSSDAGASNTLKCGAGGLTGAFRVSDIASLQPLVNAKVEGVGCTTAFTDERGFVQADLTKDQLIKLRVTAAGYLTLHSERVPQTGNFNRPIWMYREGWKATTFTGWTNATGHVVVAIADSDMADAGCSSAGGLVVSVKAHPEIAVGYLMLDDGGAPVRSAATATDPGYAGAALGPMPPGTYEVSAIAPDGGCVAGPDHGVFTWPPSTDVEPDTLSLIWLKMP